uniref:Uncharacterized protein n=1 Tax=Strongyloides papillosus TaxID=174720 RepID=A0A0N5B273_STREA
MGSGYNNGGYSSGGYAGGGYGSMDYPMGAGGMHGGGMYGGGMGGVLGSVAGMAAPMLMSGMMNGGGGAMPPMMPPMGGNTGGLDDNDITPPRGSNHNDHPSDKIDNKISNDGDVVKNRQNDIIKQGNGLGEQIQGQRPANNGNRRGWGLLRGRTNDIINQGAGSNGLGGQGTQANGNHLGLNGNRGKMIFQKFF